MERVREVIGISACIIMALCGIGIIICLALPMPEWAWLGYTFLYGFTGSFLIAMGLLAYESGK